VWWSPKANIWACLTVLLKLLAYSDTIFLLLLTSRRSTNLSAMWCVMRMSFKILWTDPNEIPKCYSQHVKNLTHRNSFVAEDKVPHMIHILFCSTCQWTSQTFNIFNRGHTISELGKPLQNSCHFHCLFPKSYFRHFWKFLYLSSPVEGGNAFRSMTNSLCKMAGNIGISAQFHNLNENLGMWHAAIKFNLWLLMVEHKQTKMNTCTKKQD
jgi:hypothetical protein